MTNTHDARKIAWQLIQAHGFRREFHRHALSILQLCDTETSMLRAIGQLYRHQRHWFHN
jgi:hypothetical protein